MSRFSFVFSGRRCGQGLASAGLPAARPCEELPVQKGFLLGVMGVSRDLATMLPRRHRQALDF